MTVRIPILDHGYLEVVESWGSDERVIESARMSTGGGFVSWDSYPGHAKGDLGLLSYLYRNKHLTPFEMCGVTIEIKAPIFVLRQWHTHRTASYNEMSARYTPLPDEAFLPDLDRCIPDPTSTNTQARAAGTRAPDKAEAATWREQVRAVYTQAQVVYEQGLDLGVPKEIARCVLPVSRYAVMRASANLRNWLAFLTLRTDSHAQEEIRAYATVLEDELTKLFPRTMKLHKGA